MTETTSTPAPFVAIIGGGPAGLMAAEVLATAGVRVVVHDRMASVGRKFLLAGRGGLNLTHSEDREPFAGRYGDRAANVTPWLDDYPPAAVVEWVEGLGQPTFTGSSGRIFPRSLKASPLLRAWLRRLDDLGVTVVTRSRWTGFDGPALTFEDAAPVVPDATILAMGGASWPRLGSDGAWAPALEAAGTPVAPFQPSNAGFNVEWSDILRDRFAGEPLKAAGFAVGPSSSGPQAAQGALGPKHPAPQAAQGAVGPQTVRGEAMLTRYGIEGGAIYALSPALREAITRDGTATLVIDLRPDLSEAVLAERLSRPRGKDSLTNWLRKAGGLSPVAIALMREIPGEIPTGPEKLAKRIKAVRLTLTGMQGLERAISSAGGVTFEGLDDRLMLTARPGVFVAGEMIDWEAPTGGYLLQASFASGVAAARGALEWLAQNDKAPA
ncbi:MAG: aminoacetone oxidase family FAD-binding enzyme [Alphaproteobacteria bacterium]|nr:MAG: aminoacetone oxidase family FAD-binding enzyme [Alphaproteobacteria bacterium]PZO33417.1 MAG: aminoacetone oxidase family FAD-binding enzyme [Alphaproteobacteria bacterium]